MQAHTFRHEGYDLHYYTAGSSHKPPIIMIHGYTSAHVVWKTTVPALQDDYFCVMIDLLGHGNSPIAQDVAAYTIEAQGRRVLALVDHLGIERFALIGHSMGGQTSMCIASMLAPERVTHLVNVSGVASATLAPFVEKATIRYIRMFKGSIIGDLVAAFYRMTGPDVAPVARFQFASWFHQRERFFGADFPMWREDRTFANRQQMTYVWVGALEAIESLDLTPYLEQITAPTLTIFGQQDNVVNVSDGHLVHEKVTGSRLLLIDDCGHFPMYEKPEAYCQAITEFLLS